MGLMTKWYNEKVTIMLPKAVGQLIFAKKYMQIEQTLLILEEQVVGSVIQKYILNCIRGRRLGLAGKTHKVWGGISWIYMFKSIWQITNCYEIGYLSFPN